MTTLAGAWREFLRRQSPRLIAPVIAALLAARIAVGGWSWRDLVAAAALVAIYPFGEWAIHVYLLHLKPFRLRGRKVELHTARAHRHHHEHPNDLGTVLLEPLEITLLLGLAVPLTPALGALAVVLAGGDFPLGAALTGWMVGAALVGTYEWCHFLIHTAYRPRSAAYRQIWRTHRLHHFKNERYWHGITNTIADRVLGTFPDHHGVVRSRTARTLDPGEPHPRT